jgi:Nif-specific regulatory protein
MAAEIIVVSGPLSGSRYGIGPEEVHIGRAPTSTVCLSEPEAAWRHCSIRPDNGQFRIFDLRSGAGTFVNGMRVSGQALEDGDQITIGETVFVFREGQQIPGTDSPRVTLLRACTLLFMFRSLATSIGMPQQELLETHIVSILQELVPFKDGLILLGREADLRRASFERFGDGSLGSKIEPMVQEVLQDGPAVDNAAGLIVVPIYAGGNARGVLVAHCPGQSARFEEYLEILSAVSTLAATALENVREVEALKTENALLQERLTGDDFGIVGKSSAMRRLMQLVERVGAQNTTILVLGESGTGKELIARALHSASPRRKKPFVAINCAALTETLLESELFGHEKGSFTGAVVQKKGKLEVAEGGTVFLDEIGELAPSLQAKLLRVLQQREFERVGGTRTLHLDVRMVAATNRDLSGEVRRGTFREDLYHRLNVVALRTPPLRERPEDVLLLAEHFLQKSARRIGRIIEGVSPEAQDCLLRYPWPGNVRELENAMERAAVLTDSTTIQPEDLPEVVTGEFEDMPAGIEGASLTGAKREAIIRAWRDGGGDYKRAAKILGIHPNSLLRLIRKLELRDALGKGISA